MLTHAKYQIKAALLRSGVMLLQTGNTSKRYISGSLASTGVFSLGQPGQVMLNMSTLNYDL